MKQIDFWFDPVSPYAYLAFERLPQVLEGVSCEVRHRPVLFAALLAHHGTKGPAEVEAKRQWTFRHVHWLAQHHGIDMQTPPRHPFNPIALLRLALACAPAGGWPNRRVVQAIFEFVWRSGQDAGDAQRLAELVLQLQPQRALDDPAVKAELKAAGDEAIALGLFGVPSFVVDGRAFWGLDSLPMLRGALAGEAWFDGPGWAREGAPREGLRRA